MQRFGQGAQQRGTKAGATACIKDVEAFGQGQCGQQFGGQIRAAIADFCQNLIIVLRETVKDLHRHRSLGLRGGGATDACGDIGKLGAFVGAKRLGQIEYLVGLH